MKRVIAGLCLVGLFVGSIGCGSDTKDEKQPKASGAPDPKIKGPAAPGTGGAKPGAGVD